jgi:hypothetical protein
MNETATTLEEVINQALHLSAEDKVRLIERLASVLKYDLTQPEPAPEPASKRSLLGIFADLGPAPSAEDIDEARREEWANFPREDIA